MVKKRMSFVNKIIRVLLITILSVSMVQASGLYSPRTVSVDETAGTAVLAKKNAFEKAKNEAWKSLLNDLTLVQSDVIQSLSVEEMNEVIQTVDVNKEKTRNNRYLADIIIYFNPKRVRDVFRRKNIAFTEERAFPMLVVPVWNEKGVSKIYEIGNKWRLALSENPKSGGLLPLVFVPDGTKASTKIDQTIISNNEKLIKTVKYYATEGAVVSTVSLKETSKGKLLTLKWRSHGAFFGGSHDTITKKVSGDDYNSVLVALVYEFYQSLENKWRAVREEHKSIGNNEQLVVFSTENIKDLQKLKIDLQSVVSIDNISVRSIEAGLVTLLIRFYLTKEKFRVALEREGYVVQQGQGIWVVKRP